MHIVIVGVKLTPPWDSAAASIGRGIIQALVHLKRHVNNISVVTTRVSSRRILSNYGVISGSIRDFEGLREGNITWYVAKHHSDWYRTEIKLALLAKTIIIREKPDVVFYVGLPKNPLILHSLIKSSKKIIVYMYTIPTLQYLQLLKYTLATNTWKEKITMCVSSVHTYKMFKYFLKVDRICLLPPVIDTHIFKPMNRIHRSPSHCLRIGYSGPLHPSRFPIKHLAEALLMVRRRGIRVFLHLRGLLRHGKKDWPYVYAIEKFFIKILGNEYLDIKIGQLSREELNTFYNSIDILLYLFELTKNAEIADPPLVPLEALSAGTPVIFSSGSSLDVYLRPFMELGFARNVDNTYDIVKTLSNILETEIITGKYSYVIHRLIDRIFSPKAMATKIRFIIEG